MKRHSAFTMIELIFVIVVMGIIGKFGVEFLARAYENFILTTTNNQLQAKSTTTVEFIASRLQYRIKDSVIVRQAINNVNFTSLASAVNGTQYLVLEWIATDIDSFRGDSTKPFWSGILDLDIGNTNLLVSPETETNSTNSVINALSNGGSGINDAALHFVGSNTDINGYGWNGVALTDQNSVMHPIKSGVNINEFVPRNGATGVTNSLAGVDIYEYYKLAWTANAVVIDYNATTNIGNLQFCTNYQPWNGETYFNNGICRPLMNDISTFRAMAIGSIIKIQVCAKSDLLVSENKDYSLCKEKTIY
ncbi:MAG: type II secretion system protein [Campylobacterales bacterium]|nr:type II secretion system protein [Campylobacterales bacterium]